MFSESAARLAGMAGALLGWRPDEFWRATPMELAAILRALAGEDAAAAASAADLELLRGAAGDFKSETGFRLYPGEEDQEPDPLIVSAEGAGQTPAFRDMS